MALLRSAAVRQQLEEKHCLVKKHFKCLFIHQFLR